MKQEKGDEGRIVLKRNSGNVRKNLEKLKIYFNEEAVVVLTKRKIPIHLRIVSSLGKNFNYHQELEKSSAIDVFVTMNKIISKCDTFSEYFHVKHQFNDLKEQIFQGTLPRESMTEAQAYIRELMLRSVEFLTKNPNVIVISSDKGGKTVIMERTDYYEKMQEYLEENISLGNYERIIGENQSSIQKSVEVCYAKTISRINPFLLGDKKISNPLLPEPYLIPLLYGGPKIHKHHIPMRPIVASTDMIGTFLSEWLLEKLQLVATSFNRYNIPNSRNIVPELRRFKLEPGHKLCSFDYVSMFTNVAVDETFKIIIEFYDTISTTTSVPADVFIECLSFFTDSSTYFLYQGSLFKQTKGLAMGNRLAQVLAEIRTNHALCESLSECDAESISFLYKYVDDVFSSIREENIVMVKEKVSRSVGMELTITEENDECEIEFLDCIFRRNPDLTISSRWMKKNYSSKSILNFHSNHPIAMKKNVITELIRHAFLVTSPVFFEDTRNLLSDVLRRSSYPEAIIKAYISTYAEAERPRMLKSPNYFVSCPFVNPLFNDIKSVVRQNKLRIRLAPKPTSNNKRVIFSKIKDTRTILSKKNSIFRVQCKICRFTSISTTKNWDVRRAYDRLLNDKRSMCSKHALEFKGHSMNENISILKTFYNKFDTDRSCYIVKDIERLKGEENVKC